MECFKEEEHGSLRSQLALGTLSNFYVFRTFRTLFSDADNFSSTTRALLLISILASARLLRKADQTRAILSVCHVMWSSKVKQNDGSIKILKDEKKVVNFIGKVCHPFCQHLFCQHLCEHF